MCRIAGVPFGLIVWALADEGVVRALGLSRGPRRLPVHVLAYGVVSHVVFGVTTEAVRGGVTRLTQADAGDGHAV